MVHAPVPRFLPCAVWRTLRGSLFGALLALHAAVPQAAMALPAAPATGAWRDARPVFAPHAMVVTAQHLATAVGLDTLRRGGNAVDAAVAIGYALAVVHPCCGNLGGGGFMTIHMANGHDWFLDFRETAPARATRDMFLGADGRVVPGLSTRSWLSVGVPGTVRGLNAALARLGTLPRGVVMQPAIDLARKGFVLRAGDVAILRASEQLLASQPRAAATFLDHNRVPRVGWRLRQPDLADTLQRIAEQGDRGFYAGPVARALVRASRRGGGRLSLADLHDYRVQWGQPLRCEYRGYTVLTTPPPGSGLVVCEVLRVLAGYPLARWGWGSARATHVIAEAERHAFADRNRLLGDPAFVHDPLHRLLAHARIDAIRASILPDRATPSSRVHGAVLVHEGRHTTQYSVLDATGNAVSVTYTINSLFGSGLMAGDTGFLLNNEMDDFTSKPGVPNEYGLVQGSANAIAAGKRPLSSMCPSIVLKDGRPFMLTGSPGGSTIISTTLQTVLDVVDFGMNAQQAADAPRMHMQQWPDRIDVEPGYLDPHTRAALRRMGYTLHARPPWGAAEIILVGAKAIEGANDRRRPAGAAMGG
ncbi:MAG: gamma-glutamyltransferase [Betaproteobacteria bacterium]|nr:gamma-glutamyltransferase [Betaproteobacteria bacterium]MBU6512775.1 gamma-glutamyltransferase [Betaproteobacteria bacterium]MDE1955550.1 gamma-glutamyltransferase [Betaproteobacteria bacterium]MDE2151846.1 gamma-glutamyltransferase [Betaproteobacteria bacterium]MDE2479231.1 gamma-glutamyltransferase [Betaproteobacteria bacterium]